MDQFSGYVALLNKRWQNGLIDYETWRRHQNKLLEWYSRLDRKKG